MTNLLLAVIYLSFISLGLPDALLGSAWPSIYPQFGVPVSYAGLLSIIISLGTIVSSLQSDRLTRRLGTGKVTAISVAITAAALFGFSVSRSFWILCLWAIPYGLGAGSVDASLNNYVALHYKSRHMSWLHCMWGVGASAGPYIMGFVLERGMEWNNGYRIISVVQAVLTAVLLFSLPLWKKGGEMGGDRQPAGRALSLGEIFRIPGALQIIACFFCYCALEQTTGLWASSYMTLYRGISAETAASFTGMFYIGITAGRALSGFITMRFSDTQMIRMGQAVIGAGVLTMLLPFGKSPPADRACPYRPRLRAHLPMYHSLDPVALRSRPLTGHYRCTDGQRLCRQLSYAPAFRAAGAGRFCFAVPVVSFGGVGGDGRHAWAADLSSAPSVVGLRHKNG